MAKTAKKRASGHTAVMAVKATADEVAAEADPARRRALQLNYFPTPPWATRALLAHVIGPMLDEIDAPTCWEPAAGEGHMADVLDERFHGVWRTDVHDHAVGSSLASRPRLDAVGSFVGAGPDVLPAPTPQPDWIITNPPFALATAFAERALQVAEEGVALLLRTAWLEGVDRYMRLFCDRPPAIVATFVERVPMTLGRWDPDADTATAYAWFVWRRGCRGTRLQWIPPGCRQSLEREADRRRFAAAAEAGPTLFDATGGAT